MNKQTIVFLFPGQGAQHLGMDGESSTHRDAVFKRANELLGYDLKALCASGPVDKLNQTQYSQVGMYVCSWIRFLEFKESRPELFDESKYEFRFAGLSLGEYTALTAAGVLSFEDGLSLVQERGEAMQAAASEQEGGMLTVIGAEGAKIASLCEEWSESSGKVLTVANYLFPKCVVASGDAEGIEWLSKSCKSVGAVMSRRLPVSGAFHTTLMDPAASRLEEAFDLISVHEPVEGTSVYTNVTGRLYHNYDKGTVTDTLMSQLVNPVYWQSTLEDISSEFIAGDITIEFGPGAQIGSMIKRLKPSKQFLDSITSVGSKPITSRPSVPVLPVPMKKVPASPRKTKMSANRGIFRSTTFTPSRNTRILVDRRLM